MDYVGCYGVTIKEKSVTIFKTSLVFKMSYMCFTTVCCIGLGKPISKLFILDINIFPNGVVTVNPNYLSSFQFLKVGDSNLYELCCPGQQKTFILIYQILDIPT